ncbi:MULTISPECIES: F0F1 ATP synthase subunit B [Porphyromonadaceae]|uniref:ATP synthase subunit b n=1 Tax=Sanguibacteroides justesenii TaxID=1547597 RepID=A0A0C3RFJ9_9PORP|nr:MULTISPECIES: F0F1 ATP synthase subunit B [Porphyromonadaceae]KIO44044.1 ATP synthase subunit B [Sanguibacteroides justesenii]KIO47296.1 ATP synthase subunit B [Sanguibacteroides justesenii]MCR9012699.1 F0F1 ATP synthase subunit B [Gabonibacter chumensis]PXZ43921.1 ATP synthase F0 subunit B [Sanguibacteroides justesenii]
MSLFTPEFGLAFWMLVVFLILLGILGKFAWPVIIKNMEERAAFIDKGVEFTREAQKDREQAKVDAQKLLAEAQKQQLEVLQQTERLKREKIEEARQEADKEARRVVEAAKLAVEQSKREAELQMRRQVGILSLQIAEKLVRRDLSTDKAQMEIIDKLLNELENKE